MLLHCYFTLQLLQRETLHWAGKQHQCAGIYLIINSISRSLLIDYDDTLKLVSKHASLMDDKVMTLCFRSRPPSVMREIEKPKEERPDFNFGLRPRLIQAGQEFKLICCVQCTPTPKVGKDRGDICVVNTMVLSIFLCWVRWFISIILFHSYFLHSFTKKDFVNLSIKIQKSYFKSHISVATKIKSMPYKCFKYFQVFAVNKHFMIFRSPGLKMVVTLLTTSTTCASIPVVCVPWRCRVHRCPTQALTHVLLSTSSEQRKHPATLS